MKRICGCHSHGGFVLSPEGLAQREQQLDAFRSVGLTRVDAVSYLDKVGSVSASSEPEIIFNDSIIEEQYRRFHNGS